jgi:2-C-methyl-D-erythritol 4-phosphate cytidylyltransferase
VGEVGVVTIPISDTVKEVVDGRVRRTVPRETLVEVIGPWVFDRESLADALAQVAGGETRITDMIGLCEVARVHVRALPVR